MATWYYPLKIWNAETSEPVRRIEVQWLDLLNEITETNFNGVTIVAASQADPDITLVKIGGTDDDGNVYGYNEFEVRKSSIKDNYTEIYIYPAGENDIIDDEPVSVEPVSVDVQPIEQQDEEYISKSNKIFIIAFAAITILTTLAILLW